MARNTGTDSKNQDMTQKVGFLNLSAENGITADTGSAQAGATALTAALNRVTVVGTDGDSVLLPAALAGKIIAVKNADDAQDVDVFPASGDAINAIAADGAYTLGETKLALFICFVDGTWDTVLTA